MSINNQKFLNFVILLQFSFLNSVEYAGGLSLLTIFMKYVTFILPQVHIKEYVLIYESISYSITLRQQPCGHIDMSS